MKSIRILLVCVLASFASVALVRAETKPADKKVEKAEKACCVEKKSCCEAAKSCCEKSEKKEDKKA